jgi:hypothetical protein
MPEDENEGSSRQVDGIDGMSTRTSDMKLPKQMPFHLQAGLHQPAAVRDVAGF